MTRIIYYWQLSSRLWWIKSPKWMTNQEVHHFPASGKRYLLCSQEDGRLRQHLSLFLPKQLMPFPLAPHTYSLGGNVSKAESFQLRPQPLCWECQPVSGNALPTRTGECAEPINPFVMNHAVASRWPVSDLSLSTQPTIELLTCR